MVYETGLLYADKYSRSLSKRDLLCYMKAKSNPVPLRSGEVFLIYFPSTTDTDMLQGRSRSDEDDSEGFNRISRSRVDRSFMTFGL